MAYVTFELQIWKKKRWRVYVGSCDFYLLIEKNQEVGYKNRMQICSREVNLKLIVQSAVQKINDLKYHKNPKLVRPSINTEFTINDMLFN